MESFILSIVSSQFCEDQERKEALWPQSLCQIWLPAAHSVLDNADFVALHPPQDVPAVRGLPAEAQTSPAGPTPLQEGDWEPAAVPGWYH